MSWVIAAAFLNEVRVLRISKSVRDNLDTQTMIHAPPLARINSDGMLQVEAMDAPQNATQKPPPLRSLLTRPVLISIANYAMVSFLDMAFLALIPLIWSTPVEFGGLNFRPVSIGFGMSLYGCVDGICQFAIFPRLVARFGLRRVYVTCIAFCAVLVILFPLENLVLRCAIGGSTVAIWPLIVLQLSSLSIFKMGCSESVPIIHSRARRWLNLLCSPRSARWRDYLRQYRDPQQAVIRRGKWSRADSSFGSMRSRTRSCGLALCVFYHEQRFGRELCIRRAAVPCVRRVEHRRAASETYVDAWRQVEHKRTGFPVLSYDHT